MCSYIFSKGSIYYFLYLKLGKEESQKKVKAGVWSSVLTVVLVDGEGLSPMDDNGSSDPYVKFKLGPEKYKSKVSVSRLIMSWKKRDNFR